MLKIIRQNINEPQLKMSPYVRIICRVSSLARPTEMDHTFGRLVDLCATNGSSAKPYIVDDLLQRMTHEPRKLSMHGRRNYMKHVHDEDHNELVRVTSTYDVQVLFRSELQNGAPPFREIILNFPQTHWLNWIDLKHFRNPHDLHTLIDSALYQHGLSAIHPDEKYGKNFESLENYGVEI